MKICLAQTRAVKGNIEGNIKNHNLWIDMAIENGADLIVFPELSLTGYEPELAGKLASSQNDPRLDGFQEKSNIHGISVAVGLPIKSEDGVMISMVIFEANKARQTYNKQILHPDEKPFFTEGREQLLLSVQDSVIAPAICFESLQETHAEYAHNLGVTLYLASVAKSQNGIEKAKAHFPKIAKKYAMLVLMCNSVGYCDNFESAGQTSVWNEDGILLGQLDSQKEEALIFDTEAEKVAQVRKLIV